MPPINLISSDVSHLGPTPNPSTSAAPSPDLPRNIPPGRVHLPPTPPPSTNRILRHQRSLSRSHPVIPSHMNHRTRTMTIPTNSAPLQIDFLIVGAGLAGLASAYALGLGGHRVRVLEKADGLHQRSGGIRVPPNLTKILQEWGLADELSKARPCRKSAFHSLETGEYLGFIEWQEDVIRESGGDFLLMPYEDLHQMLYKLAISTGATVSFNSPITSISVDEIKERPSVTLANGSVLEADIVIGADGYKSLVRDFVNAKEDKPVASGQSFYTVIVPSEKMKCDPDLAKWVDLPEWPMWMGNSRSVLAYPIGNGEKYCAHLYWPDSELAQDVDEGWDIVVPTKAINLEGYDKSIQRLFALVPDALRTKYMEREPVEDWVDTTGRVLLIGEAAHPIFPCSIHGASLAVEDAAVLGVLMSRLRTWEQIPQFMEAFQDIRQTRCTHVRLSELHNAALVTLPPGEDRDMRDAAMRRSLDSTIDWDDTRLRAQWEEIGEVFGYNAREAAEDWWIKWGALGDCAKVTLPEPMDLIYAVTKVEVLSH